MAAAMSIDLAASATAGDQVGPKCEGRKSMNAVDLCSSAVCERCDIRQQNKHQVEWTPDRQGRRPIGASLPDRASEGQQWP
jgi:hypothetical protein